MYNVLSLVLCTVMFSLSADMLIPQGMWLWLVGLVVSTGMITYIVPKLARAK
jgi:hypothetical protein